MPPYAPRSRLRLAVARLRYAYADALLQAGKDSEARHWFAAAAKLDHDQQTDAQQRVDELDGIVIDYDDEMRTMARIRTASDGE